MNRQDAKDAKKIESLEKVVVGAPSGMNCKSRFQSNGRRSVRSVRSVETEIEIEIEIDSLALVGNWPSWTPQTSRAELSRHRKMLGFSCPNPITRSFDTDSNSDPDPELASPRNFSNDLQQKPIRNQVCFVADKRKIPLCELCALCGNVFSDSPMAEIASTSPPRRVGRIRADPRLNLHLLIPSASRWGMSTETHRFKGYIFDLDGTLIDSFPAITESVNHVRTRHGLEPLSIAKVKTKVGHGLEYLLEKTVPDLDAISDQETYKTHHEKVILEKTVLLPFADEVLRQLHGEDKKIALASNKMRDFSNRILEHFGLLPLFDLVLGPESVPCRKPAPDMLEIALARWKLAPNDVLYVGDLNVDVETARAAGLPVCILLGEYPSRETLEAAAPDYLIDSLRMLP